MPCLLLVVFGTLCKHKNRVRLMGQMVLYNHFRVVKGINLWYYIKLKSNSSLEARYG